MVAWLRYRPVIGIAFLILAAVVGGIVIVWSKRGKASRSLSYDKAVMQFSQVKKSGGNKKLALYDRGVALFKLNKKDAARRDFKYAAKLGHEKSMEILKKSLKHCHV